jgi:TIR domain
MPYRYDLFISYSSADRRWAEKLYSDLLKVRPNLRIFLDRLTLRAGLRWDDQLRAALTDSHSFAVLWSDKAGAPESWVGIEIQMFEAAKGGAVDRSLVYVPLQGKRANLESLQGYPDIRELGLYDKDENQLDQATRDKYSAAWDRIVNGIIDRVTTDPDSDAIPLALLTIGQDEFGKIDPADPNVETNLSTLLTNLRPLDHAQLQARYGATPQDWRPFGGQSSITDLLDTVRLAINKTLTDYNQRPIRWEINDFANIRIRQEDTPSIRQAVAKLNSTFSFLLIDPIALYSKRIEWMFRFFEPCLFNDRTVAITLSPVANPGASYVSSSVRGLTRPILDAYFDPPIPIPLAKRFHNVGFNIDQDSDIRRLVMTGLLQDRASRSTASGNVYTGTRGA